MVWAKGKSGNPSGGKPGPRRSTESAREAIARLVDGNAPKLMEWLDKIEQEHGPLAAWKCLADVMEYHIPKLSRAEHTGANGGPIAVAGVEWTVVKG